MHILIRTFSKCECRCTPSQQTPLSRLWQTRSTAFGRNIGACCASSIIFEAAAAHMHVIVVRTACKYTHVSRSLDAQDGGHRPREPVDYPRKAQAEPGEQCFTHTHTTPRFVSFTFHDTHTSHTHTLNHRPMLLERVHVLTMPRSARCRSGMSLCQKRARRPRAKLAASSDLTMFTFG